MYGRRDRGGRDGRFALTQAELDNLGDEYPEIRYRLWARSGD